MDKEIRLVRVNDFLIMPKRGFALVSAWPKKEGQKVHRILFDDRGLVRALACDEGGVVLDGPWVKNYFGDLPETSRDSAIEASYEIARSLAKEIAGENRAYKKILPATKQVIETAAERGFRGFKRLGYLEGWDTFKPPVAHSGILLYNEVMTGCPKSRSHPCIFCNLYSGKKFGITPLGQFSEREKQLKEEGVEEAKEEIRKETARLFRHSGFKSRREELEEIDKTAPRFFWGEGNIFALPPQELLLRFKKHAKINHPSYYSRGNVEAFAHAGFSYPHIPYLREYNQLGLGTVWVGLETGDPVSLKIIKKGATADDNIILGNALQKAGIRCNAIVLSLPLDARLQLQHIIETANVINAMHPTCVYLSDLIVFRNTPLETLIQQGGIIPLGESMHQPLRAELSSALEFKTQLWNYDVMAPSNSCLKEWLKTA